MAKKQTKAVVERYFRESTPRISRNAVLYRLRVMLSKMTGRPMSDMRSTTPLGSGRDASGSIPGLLFDTPGKKALAKPINRDFALYGVKVTMGETGAAETIGDLHKLVWKKIPEKHRK